eukprot:scaffold1954_cov268-Pinguiococcus_pyrenoidosus.AAC.214
MLDTYMTVGVPQHFSAEACELQWQVTSYRQRYWCARYTPRVLFRSLLVDFHAGHVWNAAARVAELRLRLLGVRAHRVQLQEQGFVNGHGLCHGAVKLHAHAAKAEVGDDVVHRSIRLRPARGGELEQAAESAAQAHDDRVGPETGKQKEAHPVGRVVCMVRPPHGAGGSAISDESQTRPL